MKPRDNGNVEEYSDDLMVLYVAYKALEARHKKLLEAMKYASDASSDHRWSDAETILEQAIAEDEKAK